MFEELVVQEAVMKIRYSENFKKGLKQLKKKHKDQELKNLTIILDAIKESDTYQDLKLTPAAVIYKFEELKNDKTGFSSFNLCKNGGVYRLIVRPQENTLVLEIIFISTDHYHDFDPKGVMFDDE